jgi:hypothetical protein
MLFEVFFEIAGFFEWVIDLYRTWGLDFLFEFERSFRLVLFEIMFRFFIRSYLRSFQEFKFGFPLSNFLVLKQEETFLLRLFLLQIHWLFADLGLFFPFSGVNVRPGCLVLVLETNLAGTLLFSFAFLVHIHWILSVFRVVFLLKTLLIQLSGFRDYFLFGLVFLPQRRSKILKKLVFFACSHRRILHEWGLELLHRHFLDFWRNLVDHLGIRDNYLLVERFLQLRVEDIVAIVTKLLASVLICLTV